MSQVLLSLGTNLGERRQNLRDAVRHLGREMVVTAVSPVYETEPWGETDQPEFLNICLAATTTSSLRETFVFTQQIEDDLGRKKSYRWGPRLIDIDILFFSDAVVLAPDLIIPHKSLIERAFVLAPLADIVPDWVHPVTQKSVVEMSTAVDNTDVNRLPEPLFAETGDWRFETNLKSQTPNRQPPFPWGAKTYVMGIINATPDSFSGDGILVGEDMVEAAVAQAKQFVADGVDILDIGGESTRPGSQPITADEELVRILPVIKAIRKAVDVPISIDTYRADVARAALDAGADWINDVWGLRMDATMAPLVAEKGCPIVIMHNRSKPKDVIQRKMLGGMYQGAAYDDLFADIRRELQTSIDLALAAGVEKSQIIIDPGVGFGKSIAQNMQIINELHRLKTLGHPILLGPSRKSFIGYTLDLPSDERVEGTAVTVALGIDRGADIVRVHNVKEMVRVAKMTDAIVRNA